MTAYKMGAPIATQSFIGWLGEEKYKKLVNFILHYIADLDIPIKRYAVSMPNIWYWGSVVIMQRKGAHSSSSAME